MADPTFGTDNIDTDADLDDGDAGTFEFWMGQDRIAEKETDGWTKKGRQIVKRYRDERPEGFKNTHRFNILWSNVQTLMPTLYARTPKPNVARRFADQDDVGRLAAMLLERALAYSLEMCDFDSVMSAVVEDRLLPGRGTARVMYIPHFGEPIDDDEDQGEDDANEGNDGEAKSKAPTDDPLREVDDEEVIVSYVFWEDYAEAPARTWQEVDWVRYRSYMNRQELIERFGRAKGKKVNLDIGGKSASEAHKDKPPPDIYKKAEVREYWDRTKKRVIWLAPETPDLILDERDDPLGLHGFFPSPDPLRGTTTNDKRVPVADFLEYQDQALELDRLTARIDKLTQALKVSGVYPGEEKQVLQQLINDGTDNLLIPVNDWGHLMDKGGLDGIIQWVPIKQIAETLVQLYDARDRVKNLLYEITGIGDIMRGQTSPNETLGAQQLKANFSTRRIVPQQRKVAEFARDVIRLMGGVIASQFDAKTISKMTGYPQLVPVPPLPPMPPMFLPQQGSMMPPGAPPGPPMQQAGPPPPGTEPPNAGPPQEAQLPPEAAATLKPGHVTTFRNGQHWVLQNGQPRRVG